MEQMQLYDTNANLSSPVSTGLQSPLRVSRAGRKRNTYSFLEFFAGSGLVAQGLKGYFRPIWANDICKNKAAVYIANHGTKHFYLGSIAEVRGTTIPVADLAWASFPCQDLSLAGLTEGIHAARSGLVWEWLRIIDEMPLKPRLLVAENVAGLVSSAGGNHYRSLHKALTSRGYVAGAVLIDAVRWIPQSRPRVFIIAVQRGVAIPKIVLGDGPCWLQPDAVCRAAEGLDCWIWWRAPEPPPRKLDLSDVVEWDAPCASPESNARNLSLISPRHRQMLDQLPRNKRLALPGYKRTRSGSQVLELRFDNIAGCLRTPEGGSSRQLLIIKNKHGLNSRLLTVREAARLMGAPESYKLPGSYNDGYKAMGDAVAVPVARWLAENLLVPLVRSENGPTIGG